MKKVLMIHEVREWMFELNLSDYILTFDDGLYSQFHYFEKFKEIDTEKIFFISTNIVNEENNEQSRDFPSCLEAHDYYFKTNNKKHYMNWQQIHEIHNTLNCHIGGHSHEHFKHDDLKISELHKRLVLDTDMMFSTFEDQNISIKHFCFPYNKKYPLYEEILRKRNIKYFYANERTAIEDLR